MDFPRGHDRGWLVPLTECVGFGAPTTARHQPAGHHRGDWRDGGVVEQAYALNNPLIVRRLKSDETRGKLYPANFLVYAARPQVVIETVKQAEDGKGIIVRLFENERTRGKATLHAGFDVAEARIVNLLEEDIEPVEVDGNSVTLDLKPYQIVTLRLVPK